MNILELEAQLRKAVESEDFAEANAALRKYADAVSEHRDDPDVLQRARTLAFWMHQMLLIFRAGYAVRLNSLSSAASYLSVATAATPDSTLALNL